MPVQTYYTKSFLHFLSFNFQAIKFLTVQWPNPTRVSSHHQKKTKRCKLHPKHSTLMLKPQRIKNTKCCMGHSWNTAGHPCICQYLFKSSIHRGHPLSLTRSFIPAAKPVRYPLEYIPHIPHVWSLRPFQLRQLRKKNILWFEAECGHEKVM